MNFTVEVAIGSNVYVGELRPSTFVGQGQSTVSSTSLLRRPRSTTVGPRSRAVGAFGDFLGSAERLTTLGAVGRRRCRRLHHGDLAVVQMHLLDVETKGRCLCRHRAVSPFGTDLLAFGNEMTLRLDGSVVSGDPVETQSADGIRVTWTYTDDDLYERTMSLQVTLRLQGGGATTTSESRDVTSTTEGGDGGGGSYYPSEEPLRTTGVPGFDRRGEHGLFSGPWRRSSNARLPSRLMAMAFWMRWSLDHLGRRPALSPTIRSFRRWWAMKQAAG